MSEWVHGLFPAGARREERSRQEHILNVGILGALVFLVPYFLVSALGRLSSPPLTKETDVPMSVGCLVFLGVAYVLLRRGWIAWSSITVVLLAVIVPSLYFYLYRDTNNPSVILYAVPIVVTGLLLGFRASASVAVLVTIVYVGLSWYVHLVAGQPLWPLNWLAVAGAACLIVLCVRFYVRETDRALERLRQQAEELQTTNQEKSQLVDNLQALTAKQKELLDLVGELADPIIPVQKGVIVLPLIGPVDQARAARMVHTLLEGIAAHCARVAVVDVTGVSTVDTMLAQSLVRVGQAACLLGAVCVLSGLRPEAAYALSRLDVKLDVLVMCADVQSGIEYAQRQIGPAGARAVL